ncbi:MAG: glutamine synthetase III [Oscillospiraceae bacterium]
MSFNFNSFGSMVFNQNVMKERLPAQVYNCIQESIIHGQGLHKEIADTVADAMKEWAISLGATHFTHWFQPMTNVTAGKHDSFISLNKDGKVIINFSGKELIKGEPDASSFPSGGLRNTFEARGYTMWDCTSPAFVRDGTLYIPTAFCSYTGEALDAKTPLLRSMAVISEQSLRLLRLFGNKTSTHVNATVGAEQEYFLIDRKLYEQRLDLKICGRTLFGAKPSKGQEMDDHYFGRIRLRVSEFMHQLDEELWKLGITSKTKHNEAAPAQHELAPIYETVNIACDHNQLTMEMMRIVAKKNGLACLLHEKPFNSVNGSGKHNNWSLCTDDGINLLSMGKTPYEKMQFLVVLCAVIKGVDEHADLLRMAASVPGNDDRLGESEAPPAIISIFLGEQLTSALEHIASGDSFESQAVETIDTGVATILELKKDDSDRNRTSPFAFTGNKFEFRMVGSSASIAMVNAVLNTIVADSINEICERLENTSDFDQEVRLVIKEIIENHGKVIYNGNNYTNEWLEIAEQRGLPNLTNAVEAVNAITAPNNIEVMKQYGVLSEIECESRSEVMLENYIQVITIEANTMLEMSKRQILPAIIEYTGKIANSFNAIKKAGIINKNMPDMISALSDGITNVDNATTILAQKIKQLSRLKLSLSTYENAGYCRDEIKTSMKDLRKAVDSMEVMTSSLDWPMPTYTDLLHRI